jgi:hypothetical protein
MDEQEEQNTYMRTEIRELDDEIRKNDAVQLRYKHLVQGIHIMELEMFTSSCRLNHILDFGVLCPLALTVLQ